MRNGSIRGLVFAIAGFATFFVSGDLLGVGFWSLLILAVAILVGISPYVVILLPAAKVLAALVGVLAIAAALLGLLAATTGGSFRLPPEQALLLLLLGVLSIAGFSFSRVNTKAGDDKADDE